jgi:hypothetical protein
MKSFVTSNRKTIVQIYIVLTIIKLFTANIYSQREEDPTIYFKLQPTISNTFGGGDRAIFVDERRHPWYRNHQYWEIFHTNGGGARSVLGDIYDLLIISWWVSSAGLIVLAIYKLLKL